MVNTFYFDWEVKFVEFLQNSLPAPVLKFFEIFSDLGDEMAIICVVGLVYWCLNKQMGKRLCLYLSVSNIFYPMVKNIVKRTRPYMDVDTIKCIKPAYDGDIYDLGVQSFSFPSGHSANAMTVYGPLCTRSKYVFVKIIAPVVIALICLSRCILGVHYPTDVICGLLAGYIVILILDLLDKKCKSKFYYIFIALFGIIGFFYCTSNDFYTGYGLTIGAMISDVFEERFVKFEKASGILDGILRMAGGLVIFLVLSKVLKMPFSTGFLESKTLGAYIVRTLRYAIIMFIDLGLYPMLFKYFPKGKKKEK